MNHDEVVDDDLEYTYLHELDVMQAMNNVEVTVVIDHLIHSRRGELDEVDDDLDLLEEVTEVNDEDEQINDEMVECDDDLLHEQVEQDDNDEIHIVRTIEHQVDIIHEIEVKVDFLYVELEVLDD